MKIHKDILINNTHNTTRRYVLPDVRGAQIDKHIESIHTQTKTTSKQPKINCYNPTNVAYHKEYFQNNVRSHNV